MGWAEHKNKKGKEEEKSVGWGKVAQDRDSEINSRVLGFFLHKSMPVISRWNPGFSYSTNKIRCEL